jgi:hypothetical protein
MVSNPQVMLPRCKMPGSEISNFPTAAVKKTRPRRQTYPRVPLHPSADAHRFSSPAGVWVRSAHVLSSSVMPVSHSPGSGPVAAENVRDVPERE